MRDVRFKGQEQKVVVRSSLVELRNRYDREVPTLIFYAAEEITALDSDHEHFSLI